MLWVVAFCLLYFVFVRVAENVSRNYRLTALAAFLVFLGASMWNVLRNEKNRREYLKGMTESVSSKVPSQ
jgi:hypothetical protein